MRGRVAAQSGMFCYFSPAERVPAQHPLRAIKARVEAALNLIGKDLDALYSHTGRPSIAPERLLKGQLLIALYSIRSDRAFCEQLDYNLLYRWFLDLSLDEAGLDQSHFSRLRARLVASPVARRFFNAVLAQANAEGLLSTEHFTVDGTLLEALASLKSLKRRDDEGPPSDGGDGSGMRDWKGERRANATHTSTTDPGAKLMRKGNGQPAKLSYGAHVLMDNRHGLCTELEVTDATAAEHRIADRLLGRTRQRRWPIKTVGGDKGYCVKAFIARCRRRGIAPHIARIDARKTPGLDARTTRHKSYAVSQKKRKRVEEIFGWLKTYGGLRKTRFIGQARVQLHATLAACAYNLLRMAKLAPIGAT
ncbi:MAG: IS5 family transposase [Pseudomonas sp.]|uniref:IS5 family transposase n=1 Tax=Pseudomonas sp. TaxID=306 RepID=UPI003D6EB91B